MMDDEMLDRTMAFPRAGNNAEQADLKDAPQDMGYEATLRPAQPQNPGDRTNAMPNQPMAAGDDDRTLKPQGAAMPQMQPETTADGKRQFQLKGTTYYEVRSLSDNSGEAQVFLVSNAEDKEFVLKVYYPNFDINKKLLQLVRSFQFEMIVTVLDYGKTYVDGKNRHYELMEYLRGGTLRDLKLHKDVKPTNFFFRDEEQKQLVLGDFGISALQEAPGKPYRTTQARTPIFAAPEMYIDVIDGVVDITEAADYYSLGMTLFALWLGENPISLNERNMMRLKNEGRLPRLNELPDTVKHLVQGLTAVNQQSRWGYEEVEKWFLGEEVAVDLSSPFLRYKSFMVDPDRNLVADNVMELVPLLLQNEKLAVTYLYNGQIVQWLDLCGNTKLSVVVKNIVTNKYPTNQQAGLMAACYAMDPTLAYTDPTGEECDNVHDVAIRVLRNAEKYAFTLRNPDDTLFLWIEARTKCDVNRLRSYFGNEADGRVGVLRLVYEMDPELPFLLKAPSSNIDEIVQSFGHLNLDDDAWQSLCDGRLLSWLYAHEDMSVTEPLRTLTDGQTYSQALAYKVLYTIKPSGAYDLINALTPKAVGEMLANELRQHEHTADADMPAHFSDMTDPDGRFSFYARQHGWHQLLAEARQCFDLEADDNRNRLGAYDLRTALYRFCRILGVVPSYLLPDGTLIANGRNISQQLNSQMVRAEMRNGALAQWLSVFYHEDPTRDFVEEYSYERELEDWVLALGRLDQQQNYYCRYMKAREDTKTRVSEVRRQWNRANNSERLWKYCFLTISAAWMVFVVVSGLDDRSYLFSHPYTTIILPVGIMTGIIVATRSYFKGFGSTLSLLFGGVGFATAYIPYYILRYVDEAHAGWFHVAVLALTLVYLLISYLTDFRRAQKIDTALVERALKSEDIRSTLLEPLYYTFKTRSQRYKASSFGLLDEVSDQVHSLSGESVIHYALWSLMAIVMIAELLLLNHFIVQS